MNFKRFLIAMIGGVSTVFLLSACIFTATEYETKPQPEFEDNILDAKIPIIRGSRQPFGNSNTNRHVQPVRDIVSRIQTTPTDGLFSPGQFPVIAMLGNINDDRVFCNLLFALPSLGITASNSEIRFAYQHIFFGRYNAGFRYLLLTNSLGQYAVLDVNREHVDSFANRWSRIFDTKSDLGLNLYFAIFIPPRSPESDTINATIRTTFTGRFYQIPHLLNMNYYGSTLHAATQQQRLSQHNFLGVNYVNELPNDLYSCFIRPTDPDIQEDDNLPAPPTEPEYPGDEIPDEPSEPAEPELPGDDDEGDDDYDYTYPTRLNWWQQFMAWWRRQLFRD